MSYVPSDCSDNAITCDNSHLTIEQLFRDVLTFDANGCLVLRTSATGGDGGAGDASAANQATEIARLNSILGQLDITQTAAVNLIKGAGAKDFTTLDTLLDARVGPLTETAPATDTASSGLNGRLQRIAQLITSLITLIPASLGQKTMANSLAVTIASDQPLFTADNTLAPSSSRTVGLVAAGVAVKGSAGNVYGWLLNNSGGTDAWVKFSNIAAGSLVVGTTPVVLSLLVPAGGQSVIAPNSVPVLGFTTAITIYSVTESTDAGTTAPTAGSITVNILYK